jgi:integrase
MERAVVFADDGVYIVRISPSRDRKRGRLRIRWKVDSYYKGHRENTRASATFCHRDDADLCARQVWSDYAQGLHSAPENAPHTVGGLINLFLARTTSKRGRTLSPKTIEAYRSQLGALKRIAGADLQLLHLTSRHIEAVIREPHHWKDEPKSRATAAQYLRAIRAMVAWAVRKGWLAVDITEEVTFDPGPYQMRPFLQVDEIAPYLKACSPAHRIRSGLVLETGLRVSEATHLRWDWIINGYGRPSLRVPASDLTTGFRTKGNRVRTIPLSAKAQAFLKEASEKWGNEGFVLHALKTPPATRNWGRLTHSACRKANITDTDFHGLRRTAGVLWLSAGVDIYTVSRLLGHQSVQTTERAYAGISDNRLTAVMDIVDRKASDSDRRGESSGTCAGKTGNPAAPPAAPPNEKGEPGNPELP